MWRGIQSYVCKKVALWTSSGNPLWGSPLCITGLLWLLSWQLFTFMHSSGFSHQPSPQGNFLPFPTIFRWIWLSRLLLFSIQPTLDLWLFPHWSMLGNHLVPSHPSLWEAPSCIRLSWHPFVLAEFSVRGIISLYFIPVKQTTRSQHHLINLYCGKCLLEMNLKSSSCLFSDGEILNRQMHGCLSNTAPTNPITLLSHQQREIFRR